VPFPAENPLTEAKRVLGKALFFEEQLSSSDRVSCATCHIPGIGGADPRLGIDPGAQPFAGDDVLGSPGVVRSNAANHYSPDDVFGLDEQVTGRTAQGVHASQFASELFWDGRAGDTFLDPETGAVVIATGGALESQAVGPILSDVEMAHEGRTWDQVRAKLEQVRPLALATELPGDLASALASASTYPELFEQAFGDPSIDAERIGRAIATYERTLIPDQTPFDEFLEGNPFALTPSQRAGFDAFSATNCRACHAPPLMSDDQFHNIGLRPLVEDQGRFDVTGNPADRGRFRTPSLRNVGLRDRYMHTGKLATLEDVIGFYNDAPGFQQFTQNQSPLIANTSIPPDLVDEVVDFLENALTDPRAAAEVFPFDRPILASERAELEQIDLGPGTPGTGGTTPRWTPVAPAAAGSSDFRLGLRDAQPNAIAVLAIGTQAVPGSDLFGATVYVDPSSLVLVQSVVTTPSVAGTGHATVELPLGSAVSLVGTDFVAQWFVLDAGASGGLAATSGLGFTIQ
jgi:cytochrome c peroxidase